VLIVDEVLAVGDVAFQKRCLGKMRDISGDGRTVLFVSHNLTSMKNLCSGGLLLKEGRIVERGHIESVLDHYSLDGLEVTTSRTWNPDSAPGDESLKLLHAVVEDSRKSEVKRNRPSEVKIIMLFRAYKRVEGADVGLAILNSRGEVVVHTTQSAQNMRKPFEVGDTSVSYTLPSGLLASDNYIISLSVVIPFQRWILELPQALKFNIAPPQRIGSVYDESSWQGALSPSVGEWCAELS
jgi:lipopolysaccharide transport system ATP-binding protein